MTLRRLNRIRHGEALVALGPSPPLPPSPSPSPALTLDTRGPCCLLLRNWEFPFRRRVVASTDAPPRSIFIGIALFFPSAVVERSVEFSLSVAARSLACRRAATARSSSRRLFFLPLFRPDKTDVLLHRLLPLVVLDRQSHDPSPDPSRDVGLELPGEERTPPPEQRRRVAARTTSTAASAGGWAVPAGRWWRPPPP